MLTRRDIPSAKLLFGMALLFGLLASAYAQVAVYVTEDPGVIGKYKTSGKPINSKFITGLNSAGAVLAVNGKVFIGNSSNQISEYNASTGALINASFISGLNFPLGMAVSGNNFYVANYEGDSIGLYDATTGLPINSSFITGLGYPVAIAISGNNLFVTNNYDNSDGDVYISEYDATTGALIKANFIEVPPSHLFGLAVKGDDLFVCIYPANRPRDGSVAKYNVTTGALIKADFIKISQPYGIALSGNTLFVANEHLVYEFDATTGAKLSEEIRGLDYPVYLSVGPIK